MVLTADFGGSVEGSSNSWVHADGVALLLGDRLVSFQDDALDPGVEWSPDDRVDHVADPLLRDLEELLLVRQVVVHVLAAVVEVVHDMLECQALVLRDRDMSDHLALDHYIENTLLKITLHYHNNCMATSIYCGINSIFDFLSSK